MSNPALPGVQVTQNAVSPNADLSDAELFATFVTPLYRLVTNHSICDNAPFAANLGADHPILINYPVVDAGAVIDLSSIILTIKDGIVKWLSKTVGALHTVDGSGNVTVPGFVAGSAVFTDPNTDFLVAGVTAGDVLVVGDGATAIGEYVILSVAQHALTFTYPIYMTFTGTDTGYFIKRSVSSWLLGSSCFTSNQTRVSITAVTMSAKPFLSGEIDISYRALRKDKTGLFKYTNLSDVLADMEVSSIDNKIGYFIEKGIIPANGNTTAFLVYFLDDDTQLAYLNALSDLASHSETYMLVPLTEDSTVVAAYATHAAVMSTPEESLFRVVFASTPLVTQLTLAEGSVTLS